MEVLTLPAGDARSAHTPPSLAPCKPTKALTMILQSKLLRLLSVGIASAGLLAACGGSDDDSFDDRADVADPKVRFVHAVPGAVNVTLQRNGANEANATDVAYKYGSQYYDVSTTDYTFTLRTTLGTTDLATLALSTNRGNKFTVVALPTATGVELLGIRDPYNKSVTSDDARVRVMNAAANAAAFDVYISAPAADLLTETADLASIGYKAVKPDTGSDSLDLQAGTYRIRLTPTGSKIAFFNAVVTVPADGDWLLLALPEVATTPNSVRVLLVRSDDTGDATDELVTE
jgi:Domain of unknown function (DUF4397)